MKVKAHICKSGTNPESNEDYLIFKNHHFAMLLDGSTGLGKAKVPPKGRYHTMAQWFVHRMGELVREKIEQAEDLKQMLGECISILKEEYEAALPCSDSCSPEERRLQEPSASLALLRETDRQVELFLLGDLSVLLKYADGQVEQLHDDSVRQLDEEALRLIAAVREEQNISGLQAVHTEAVQEKLKENRLKKNSREEKGYWILGLDKEALDYGKTYCWDKDSGQIPVSMILCSDGFAACYEKYGCSGAQPGQREKIFYETVEEKGLKKLYKKLRAVENSDRECINYLRFKPSDDASALWIELKEHNPLIGLNVKLHRFLGRSQSIWMTFRASKPVIITLVTALVALVDYGLKLVGNENGKTDWFDSLAYICFITASVCAMIDIIISYRKWRKGMRIISDSAYKKEMRDRWKLGETEKNDGFEIKTFFNGNSYEYYIESDLFNRALQAGKQIKYTDMKYKYRLPEELKKLVPKIMEYTFCRPGIVFNGRLLRQASHIELNGKSVLVQKACYFDGQCSHEIVYKQFFSPEQIDVFFDGKKLLVSQEDILYDLNRSSCANFLGASTLMITKDKYLIIGKQGLFSKANRGRYAPSGSGSVDYADIQKACRHYGKSKKNLTFNEILTFAMEREFCEECNYDLKKARFAVKTMLTGYVRLLERGGKPDYFGLSYLDEEITSAGSNKKSNIRKLEYGLVDRLELISFEKWEEIPDKLEAFVKEHQSNGAVSIQLYLLMQHVKDMKEQGILGKKLKELGYPLE